MGSLHRLRLSSLRFQLGIAALGGLFTTSVLTGLLLLTASSADDVVQTARDTHERVRVYTQLEAAADEYQRLSYQNARKTGRRARREIAIARARFENLLAEAGRLPDLDERDEDVRHRIAVQGANVLAHFADSGRHVDSVDRMWRQGGSRAALREVSRISQPVMHLQMILQSEIRRGDWKVAEGTRHAQSLIGTSVIGAFAGLLIAIMFLLIVQGLLQLRLRPALRRLEAGAQAFGSGDLSHRIGLAGADEFARLSLAFDTMAATVEEKQEALRAVRLGLEQTVAERTRKLSHANAELSAVDERRRAFLAEVGHELRTPLTVIRGETQVALRLADRPDFDPHEVFERIIKQTEDMSRMVGDLFIIALAEAGGLALDLQRIDLAELVCEVVADFGTLARETGGSIHTQSHAPVFVLVDKGRMRRALAALIDNALHHCQPGVRIVLNIETGADRVTVAVCDNGPGIDFTQARLLFEPFRRGESRGEGSGLGLSLVSALTEAHGGQVALRPQAGGGTRAIIVLPFSAEQKEAA